MNAETGTRIEDHDSLQPWGKTFHRTRNNKEIEQWAAVRDHGLL